MVPSVVVQVPNEPAIEVRLDQDNVTVGRADQNVLPLRDMNVSRKHFSIQRRGEYWVLTDAQSRNGTLVNGVAVLNKVLVEGDRVQAGGSQLTFRVQASDNACSLAQLPRSGPGTPGARSPVGGYPLPGTQTPRQQLTSPLARKPSVFQPNIGSGFGFSPQPAAAESQTSTPPPSSRPAEPALARGEETIPKGDKSGTREGVRRPRTAGRQAKVEPEASEEAPPEATRWRKLAEVACAINVVHELDQLFDTILDAVLALVPAKSAYLVLHTPEGELEVQAHRNAPTEARAGDTSIESFRLSRQICREAIEQGRPVLTQDAVGDEQLGQFVSVVNLQLKSILCVPFASQGENLGVVYLDEPGCDPFADEGEEVELVGAFGDLAGIALANARMLLEVKERERLEQEVAIAGRIQGALLPSSPPEVDGLELAGQTRAARHVGGDIYDFFARDTPREDVLISIGDVAGKGVGAGMVMASVRALLRALAEVVETSDELLIHLNRVLSPDLDPGIFVSFLLLRYDPPSGQLYYTGAGHEHLIVYRPGEDKLTTIRAGGVVLGLVDDLRGRISEEVLTLKPGDVVCLYTDGATEAPDTQGEEFGLERVAAAVRGGPSDPAAVVERVMAAVDAFSEGVGEQHDDLTVVALRKG